MNANTTVLRRQHKFYITSQPTSRRVNPTASHSQEFLRTRASSDLLVGADRSRQVVRQKTDNTAATAVTHSHNHLHHYRSRSPVAALLLLLCGSDVQ